MITSKRSNNLLGPVAVVPLGQHDLLRDDRSLLDGTEANNVGETWVRLLVAVRHTHTTTDGNIEPSQLAMFINDRDETKIVSEDIDVVGRWHCHCDFELKKIQLEEVVGRRRERTLRGR